MDTGIIIAIVVGGVLVAVMAREKKGSKKKAPPIITGKSGWYFAGNSVGMPAQPTTQGAGWSFDFPVAPGHVNYVQWVDPPPFVGAKSINLSYAVTGGGFVAPEEDAKGNPVTAPGRVGLCLLRKGYNWYDDKPQHRLYSQSRPLLKAGEGSLVASVWTDLNGKVVPQSVVDAVLADLDSVAVVFGGSFAGHGVYSTQGGKFQLHSLT